MSADESRKLEDLRAECERLRREVRDLSTSSNKFLAVATHDLRAPLASLQLIADLLEEHNRVSPDARHLVDTMKLNIQTMTTLVTDVLNASRLSHPGSRIEPEEFEFNRLVEDILAGFFPQAIANQVTIDAHLSSAAGSVVADRKRVGQMINNLVSNAIKFTPSGGTVVVATDGDAEEIELSVSDTGPGLTPTDSERLFSSFFRGSARPLHGEACTGLGLYITRRIAEAHGGSVGAEGSPGKGSIFFIKLPRKAKAVPCEQEEGTANE